MAPKLSAAKFCNRLQEIERPEQPDQIIERKKTLSADATGSLLVRNEHGLAGEQKPNLATGRHLVLDGAHLFGRRMPFHAGLS